MIGRLSAIVFFIGALASPSARADVVAPPPTDCPEGTVGSSNRNGGFCAPTVCDDEHACTDVEMACSREPMALCVRDDVVPMSFRSATGVETYTQRVISVAGPCDADGACPQGGTCRRERRCVPRNSSRAGGGLCSISTGAAVPATSPLAHAIVFALLLRRTSRCRSRC